MVDNGPTDAAAATWGLSHALAGVVRSVASVVRSLAHQLSLCKKIARNVLVTPRGRFGYTRSEKPSFRSLCARNCAEIYVFSMTVANKS